MFAGAVWKSCTTPRSMIRRFTSSACSAMERPLHIDNLRRWSPRRRPVRRVRIHALLDGRDVGELSALDYFLLRGVRLLNDANFDARIASGGGRMVITMDRRNAN